jgi:phospholipid/cholesterol/gamma-HCH transport system substrate-binding protein
MRFSDIRTGSEDRSMTPLRAGLLAAVLIALFAYFGFTKANPFADPYELNAVFKNTNRLAKRSPVRIAGVDVGKVVDVRPMEDGSGLIKVKMQIRDKGLPIKRDAELTIRSRLFLEGNYFVDLQPGRPTTPELEEGGTIPPNQTASPVQFSQVLSTLQSETREDLRTLLYEYSQALKREGAAGFNLAVKHWEDAWRNTSQVNDATLGLEPHDLTRVLKGQGRVFGALSRDEERLKDLVTDLNDTIAGFARQEDNLRAAIPELRDVFREGRPALASLNRALPEIRGFARDALPGARSSSPTLDAQIPFVRQLRRLFSKSELRGLSRQLASAVPSLARLNSRSPKTFAQNRALASCQHSVLVPFAKTPIPDPDFPSYHSGRPWFHESGPAFVGLSGESRLTDANSSFFHTQAGGGATTVVSTGEAGERLYGQLLLPINGVRPARPLDRPVYRPNVPCENQEPPDMNAPGGPAPEQTTASSDSPLPLASRKRERARPEAYRRLREFVQRSRKGLPALDPLVWWGEAERNQLRRMGLKRNEEGRIVKLEAGR